ncbi:uncharacterized protein N7496_005885 [Penicillium cataractarum]|uniref:Uncharacterized protein n=1 Tax=Penicillium cataractarum TaxID=2100454 RepID=A0A9W9S567_9EURO|nr:uncharacterized protein N7496_005885 [Penicillium cataractarum]KAJ5369793.1 hypothetical protein N7496_005885 [Penicillium cataractarum]
MASLGDDEEGALEGLPAESPKYKYQGLSTCLETIESQFSRDPSSSDFISDRLIFYNIPPHESQTLAAQLKDTSAKFSSYDFTHHILTLKIASHMHATATQEFDEIVTMWKMSMAMRRDLSNSPGKVKGGSKDKVPDAAWTPRWYGADINRHWPSMVLEVVYTNSRKDLEDDITFWLKESAGEVKVAVSISIQPKQAGKVTLEQWKFTPSARETRLKQGKPRVVQTKTATRKPGLAPVISSGNFVLPFEDIILKPAASETTACDLVVSDSDMEELAKVIWDRQFGTLER